MFAASNISMIKNGCEADVQGDCEYTQTFNEPWAICEVLIWVGLVLLFCIPYGMYESSR